MSKYEREEGRVTIDEWRNRDCKNCANSEGMEASRYIFCTVKRQTVPIGYVCEWHDEKEKTNT